MAKGYKTGGRAKGGRNKRTLEEAERARIEVENAGRGHPNGRVEGTKRLAKDVLDEFMHLFAGMAAHYQPVSEDPPEGVSVEKHKKRLAGVDEPKFLIYAKLAVQTAEALADFQSPKFKAHHVVIAPEAPAPRQIEGNVVQLNDPIALARIYNNMIKQVG